MRKLVLTLSLMFIVGMVLAQTGSVKGKIVDPDTKGPLIGANVVIKGTTTGSTTDVDGIFTINGVSVGSTTLVITYIGFETKEVSVNVKNGQTTDLGSVALDFSMIGLAEVEVIASFAIDRQTPVAVSTLKGAYIEEKVGNQEFPEILKYTPSIYTTKSGGGFGDARINVRGFDQRNTAVMINGIPVNDMENGWVYWSNWAGLSDVSNAIQVQRGLGASKLAVSSVGGSINIITKASELKKGGSLNTSVGNDGYYKLGLSYNTGLLGNGWAMSFQGTRTAGNGYVNGTQFSAWSYFASISKNLGDNQTIVLTALGAPQWHHQRTRSNFDDITLQTFKDKGIKYNDLYGDLDGEEFSWRKNFYHKPKIFLNHYLDISSKTSLNSSVYFSLGNGGGTGPRGRGANFNFDSSPVWRNADGTVRFNDIKTWQSQNLTDPDWGTNNVDPTYGTYTNSSGPGLIRRASMNYHTWTGLLSTLTTELSDQLTLTAGIDARYYKGEHFRRVENLLGLDAYLSRANDNNPTNFITDESPADFGNFRESSYKDGNNVLNYWNDGLVNWFGLFSQLEYSANDLSAFISLSGSSQGFKRIDYFNYLDSDPDQETDWNNYLGGIVKGGANYNISTASNIFFNAGYISRQPIFDNVYVNFVNDLNPDVKNQTVVSVEGGYGYRSRFLNVSVNLYHTQWENRQFDASEDNAMAEQILYNFENVGEVHQGLELEVSSSPTDGLNLGLMASLGNWRYTDDFQASGSNIDNPSDPTNYSKTLYLTDLEVGDAAQTTFGINASYTILGGLKLWGDFYHADRLFAQWQVSENFDAPGGTIQQLPSYSLVDAGVVYNIATNGNIRISVRGTVNNLFDTEYIAEMYTNNDVLLDNEGFYGFGRTWNAGIRVSF